MSVLSTPRITFRGQVSWDPIVTNNDQGNYDEATGEIQPGSDTAQDFRSSAIEQVLNNGNWNPHGTHRSSFFDTYITGVDLGSGAPVKDPFIGVPVAFSGMLVDLEPYGSTTSQLFFDQMSFGIQGGCCISARRAFRFTDRYINFSRNTSNFMIAGVAGITWQTCFPKDHLTLAAHDSPVLQAFIEAMQDTKVLGLMVRWQAYRTVYFGDPTLSNGSDPAKARQNKLHEKLKAGGWQPNPARSLLVGTIGLWYEDEPVHEPGDRALLPQGATLNDGTTFGPVFARLGDSSITFDLGSFMPERDREASKHDLGPLKVIAVDASGSKILANIGTIPYSGGYDKEAYEAASGIFTLQGLSAEAMSIAKTSDLRILDASGIVLAAESAQRCIPDDPNLYLDEGSAVTSTVRVYERGVPAGVGISVQLYDDQGKSPCEPQSTDESGRVSFQFAAGTSGVIQYGFGFKGEAPPNLQDTTSVTFMSVRVLPADAKIAALPPTWENVYEHVLKDWYAMAPCMDNWLMLNEPAMVSRYGPMVKKLTAPENFESFRYMPVTRDLSVGKRTLLYNYLDGLQPASTPPALASTARKADENVILITPSRQVQQRFMASKNMPA